uniref:CBM20 domain-containing protein n=1 Tax=Alexandrium monilatum TaxID=311494 RepID=A0A7S4W2Z8_9DINO|mmetsp:Transcript_108706/g.325170  ORF Transcript_108706/g.325170 Transcript_108706/m.325170 type:complete len:486 (-) Transcript_108706:86-1543(-)
MPSIGVLFEIRRAPTMPGEAMRVTGALPELGAWDPWEVISQPGEEADALALRTGALRYPCWSMPAPLWIKFESSVEGDEPPFSRQSSWQPESECVLTPESSSAHSVGSAKSGETTIDIEYKYLKDVRQLMGNGSTCFEWEDSIANRRVTLPRQAGAMFLISDALWDSAEPPRVSYIVQGEVVERCMELDPDHVLGKKDLRNTILLDPGAEPETGGKEQSNSFFLSPGGTPGNITPTGPLDFDIEQEFEALASKKLPTLLAEKLAAEQTASELATEVMRLQREFSLQGAEKERAEDECKALRSEVEELRRMVLGLTESVEASTKKRAMEAERLEQENASLHAEVAELRSELGEARVALKIVEDCSVLRPEMEAVQAELELHDAAIAAPPAEDSSPHTPPPRRSGPLEDLTFCCSPSKELLREEARERCPSICEKAPEVKEVVENPLLMKVKGSLSKFNPTLALEVRQEQETELSKALRRRREIIGC